MKIRLRFDQTQVAPRTGVWIQQWWKFPNPELQTNQPNECTHQQLHLQMFPNHELIRMYICVMFHCRGDMFFFPLHHGSSWGDESRKSRNDIWESRENRNDICSSSEGSRSFHPVENIFPHKILKNINIYQLLGLALRVHQWTINFQRTDCKWWLEWAICHT